MYYDKKIKYLDYMENQERVRGCGFVKSEVRDEAWNVEVNINGLPKEESGVGEIMLLLPGAERALGKIALNEGRGVFKVQYNSLNHMFENGGYEGWGGLRIPLQEGREICGLWKGEAFGSEIEAVEKYEAETKGELVEYLQERGESVGSVQSTVDGKMEGKLKRTGEGGSGNREDRNDGDGKGGDGNSGDGNGGDGKGGDGNSGDRNGRDGNGRDGNGRDENRVEENVGKAELYSYLKDEKWQQLCAIYQHVNPFRDEREYLSITPSDFVLLTANSYKKVNNSFLLHGFFNYHHLLLAKLERKGETTYYVGVPGNYFEREKQVAIMFGFESFECAVEPAQAGDFGYYMMRVEL